MGQYLVELTEDSQSHMRKIKKTGNKALMNKISALFLELSEHPYSGTGKPEALRHRPNTWSRRLDKKNRLVYTVHDDRVVVVVLSLLGYYDDK